MKLKTLLPLLLALCAIGFVRPAHATISSCYEYKITDSFETFPDGWGTYSSSSSSFITFQSDAPHAATGTWEAYFRIYSSPTASSGYLNMDKDFDVANAGAGVYWIPRLAGCPAPVVRAANPSTEPDTCYATAKIWSYTAGSFSVVLVDKSTSPWTNVGSTDAYWASGQTGYSQITVVPFANGHCSKHMNVVVNQYPLNSVSQIAWVDDVTVHWGYNN